MYNPVIHVRLATLMQLLDTSNKGALFKNSHEGNIIRLRIMMYRVIVNAELILKSSSQLIEQRRINQRFRESNVLKGKEVNVEQKVNRNIATKYFLSTHK